MYAVQCLLKTRRKETRME